MKIKFTHNNAEQIVDLEPTWIWVRLEDELGLTLLQAQEKMSQGSTKIITFATWIASESKTPYLEWVKDFKDFDIVGDDDPKENATEV